MSRQLQQAHRHNPHPALDKLRMLCRELGQYWADKLIEGGKWKRTYPPGHGGLWVVDGIKMVLLTRGEARARGSFHRVLVRCPICFAFVPAGRIWQHTARADHMARMGAGNSSLFFGPVPPTEGGV